MTPPGIFIDTSDASIATISLTTQFAAALARGRLPPSDAGVAEQLQEILGEDQRWIDIEQTRLASILLRDAALAFLPLEWQPPVGFDPIVVRCELEGTQTAPRAYTPRPEETRMLLALSDAGGSLELDMITARMAAVTRAGFQRFDDSRDVLHGASKAGLVAALREDVAVLQLVCHVREAGLVLHGEDGPEVLDAEALADLLAPYAGQLRAIVLLPACTGAGGDPGRAIVELALALHRRGHAAIVAPRVPLPAAELAEIGATLVHELLGDIDEPPRSLERAIACVNRRLRFRRDAARLGLRLYARAADGDDTRPFVICPYRGSRAFEREHARFFFGRERETAEVIRRIGALAIAGKPRFVLLVGAAGVGKSSLARAGVLPALLGETTDPCVVLGRPRDTPKSLLEARLRDSEGRRRVVVIDQLEQLFSDASDLAGASRYLQQLWQAAGDDHGSMVIGTLRIDALNRAGALRVAGRTLESLVYHGEHALFVRQLEQDQLARAIELPAALVGLEVEPDLVNRLVSEALAEPGGIGALEHLWRQQQGRRLQ